MPHFLITIHRPNDYDPSVETPAQGRAIDDLNDAMVEAGIRIFVGGLRSITESLAIHRSEDGILATQPGLYLDCGEHVGGLWVIETATMDEATNWGRRAAEACRASVEVRQFH
jgi:hypothetical protein